MCVVKCRWTAAAAVKLCVTPRGGDGKLDPLYCRRQACHQLHVQPTGQCDKTKRSEQKTDPIGPQGYILLAPFSTKGSLLRSTCPRRFSSVALGVRLASRTMQQALPSPQQQMAAMKAKQAALTAPQKEEAKVKVRVVLQEAQAKFQQYLSTAAYYGLVPLALTVGTWTNNLELRDLLSGVRLPLLD